MRVLFWEFQENLLFENASWYHKEKFYCSWSNHSWVKYLFSEKKTVAMGRTNLFWTHAFWIFASLWCAESCPRILQTDWKYLEIDKGLRKHSFITNLTPRTRPSDVITDNVVDKTKCVQTCKIEDFPSLSTWQVFWEFILRPVSSKMNFAQRA